MSIEISFIGLTSHHKMTEIFLNFIEKAENVILKVNIIKCIKVRYNCMQIDVKYKEKNRLYIRKNLKLHKKVKDFR